MKLERNYFFDGIGESTPPQDRSMLMLCNYQYEWKRVEKVDPVNKFVKEICPSYLFKHKWLGYEELKFGNPGHFIQDKFVFNRSGSDAELKYGQQCLDSIVQTALIRGANYSDFSGADSEYLQLAEYER